jgi:hypothetical protein
MGNFLVVPLLHSVSEQRPTEMVSTAFITYLMRLDPRIKLQISAVLRLLF